MQSDDSAITQLNSAVCGVFPSTPIATPGGWVRADQLRAMDRVLTVGAAPQPIQSVSRQSCRAAINLPIAALGNRIAVALPAAEHVLLASDFAVPMCGAAMVLVPIAACVGWRGVSIVHSTVAQQLRLTLVEPDLIYAGHGLILACPGKPTAAGGAHVDARPPPFSSLSIATARQLIACLMAYDLGRALGNHAAR